MKGIVKITTINVTTRMKMQMWDVVFNEILFREARAKRKELLKKLNKI